MVQSFNWAFVNIWRTNKLTVFFLGLQRYSPKVAHEIMRVTIYFFNMYHWNIVLMFDGNIGIKTKVNSQNISCSKITE
jgi:hypothetical protein